MSFQTRRIREKEPRHFPWKKAAILAISITGPLLRLYAKMQRKKEEKILIAEENAIIKRTCTIVFALFIVILLLLGGIKALAIVQKLSPLHILSQATGAPLRTDKDGYINILLLGVGDDTHEGIDLTDSIMLVSIDTKTKSAIMLSLPRDLEVLTTQKMGKGRINSLYRDYKILLKRKGGDKNTISTEAMEQLSSELSSLLSIDIPYVVKINFSGFEKAIDSIGGIDIDVPKDLVDNEYPISEDRYGTFTLSAGMQHMDGATALKYVRSRHSTSDFSRSARQQQIISAVTEKLKKNGFFQNVSHVMDLYNILSTNIESTFSIPELMSLASLEKDIDTSRIVTMQLSDQNGLYSSIAQAGGLLYAPPRAQFNGASVLLPLSADGSVGTWNQLALFMHLLLRHRDWFIAKPRIAILNASLTPGIANRLGAELIRYGFNVVHMDNYEKKDVPTSFILKNQNIQTDNEQKNSPSTDESEKAKESLAAFLGNSLSINSVRSEQTTIREKNPDIVIVIGKDYRYRALSTGIKP